jgi:hypothetical protein
MIANGSRRKIKHLCQLPEQRPSLSSSGESASQRVSESASQRCRVRYFYTSPRVTMCENGNAPHTAFNDVKSRSRILHCCRYVDLSSGASLLCKQ